MNPSTITRLPETAYDDAGPAGTSTGTPTSGPALLFLPGWCGDRGVFADVAALTRGHRRSLALDLPEHGARRPAHGPVADFTTADAVDDAVTLLDQRGVERVVPVVLSHAGWAAIELRRRLGADRVPGIVLVDWMVAGAPPGFLGALAGLQDEGSWAAVRGQLFAMWTSGLEIPALHDYVEAMGTYGFGHWSRAGREIAAAFTAEGTPLAALERLAAADRPCPTLHVYAQPDDPTVLAGQQAYAAEHPWFAVHRLAARSHFPMFEVPGELARVVEGFACRVS